MANLINKDIVDAGRILISHVQNGAVLIPTRIVIGSGKMPAGKPIQSMTDVITPVMELTVTKREQRSDGRAIFGGTYRNEDIDTAFFYREIALFCMAEYRDASGNIMSTIPECLYLYGNFGDYADLLPAYGGETVVERNVDLVTWVGGAGAKVELTVESGMNPSYEDLKKLVKKDGDTMSGPLDMDGNRIKNLPVPVEGGDAASKSYADSAAKQAVDRSIAIFTADIGTTWTESNGYYIQSVVVPGIQVTDRPFIDLLSQNGMIQSDEECDSFASIRRIWADDGYITVYSIDKTDTPIRIQMEVHRASGSSPSEIILEPGDGGAVAVEVDEANYAMANTELGKAPSSPKKYSFEII